MGICPENSEGNASRIVSRLVFLLFGRYTGSPMTKTLRFSLFLLLFVLGLFFGVLPVYADEVTATETAPEAVERTPDGAAAAKPTTSAAKTDSLSAEQQKLKEMLSSLLDVSKNVNEAGAKGAAARKQVEDGVNWDHVAQICLGGPAAWKKQSASNRNQFSKLLKDIISLTAYSRMSTFWEDTKYSIDKVKVTGSTGIVSAKFSADDEEYVLDYYFEKQGGNWKIFDLSVDEDKYSDNITQQIKAFLKENNFATLLQRLEKRRADLKNPPKDDKAAKSEKL